MKYLILVTSILYALNSPAQNMDKWRAGSANELSGKIYILSIFITTKKEKWTYEDKTDLIACQLKAQDWLISNASHYGVDISFENGFYGVKNDLYVDKIKGIDQLYENRLDWVNSILTTIGYSSPLEFLDKLKFTKDCSNALAIIYANEKGRSYAVPYNTDMNKTKYFFEGCVCYRYSQGHLLCSATIAHEILHLFGAWDLYYEKGRYDKKKANKAWELYPKDIMGQNPCDINDYHRSAYRMAYRPTEI
jgi:hypothetical protein